MSVSSWHCKCLFNISSILLYIQKLYNFFQETSLWWIFLNKRFFAHSTLRILCCCNDEVCPHHRENYGWNRLLLYQDRHSFNFKWNFSKGFSFKKERWCEWQRVKSSEKEMFLTCMSYKNFWSFFCCETYVT